MFTDRCAVPNGSVHASVTMRWRRRRIVVLAAAMALVFAMPPAVAADRLVAADRRAIEATIRQQLDAFGRDDAETAFGYATPDIQRIFGSSDNFLHMVRESYEPVYRSAGVEFGRLDAVDGNWVQTVQIVDGEGRVWRALFTMKRQPDKTWKVGGCQLVQTRAIAT